MVSTANTICFHLPALHNSLQQHTHMRFISLNRDLKIAAAKRETAAVLASRSQMVVFFLLGADQAKGSSLLSLRAA